MALEPVRCPYCGSDHVCKHGQNKQGVQRYLCRNTTCQRSTFLQKYANQACRPGMKERIVDMALNGSGIRDTARVLGVSPVTVIQTLKKRIRTDIGSCSVLGGNIRTTQDRSGHYAL